MNVTRKDRRVGEKRGANRLEADFAALIMLDSGRVIRCQVKDFSATGALLVVPSVLGIPEEFVLKAPTGQARRVKVMRRSVARLGVTYL